MLDQQQMATRQQVLAEFGALALRSDDLDEILTKACQLVGKALGTDRAKVLEIQDGGQELLVRAGVGWEDGVVGHLRLRMSERSSETYSILEGKPVISQDIRSETRFEIPAFMKEAGVVAMVNVPIFVPSPKAYGLLQVDALEPREFGEEDVGFLRTYATILGPVIDRLRKMDSLRASEERFRLIVESTLDYAIFTTDAHARIDGWFPGAEAVFGWTAAEAQGKSASMVFTPEDRAAHEDAREIEIARRDGSAPNMRWHLRKDGGRVFIEGVARALHDANGTVRGFTKIGQDVTQRRRNEERLRASEARQRALIEGMPQLVWRAVDGGHWTWASSQWTNYTGLSDEDSRDWGWLDAVHPDDRQTAREAWARTETGQPLAMETRLYDRAGDRYRWFATRAAPVRDGAEDGVEWIGTCTDIDDLRGLQERQRVMVAELQHRTRNLIAVVRSVARQTMAASDGLATFRDAFNERLAALARVQGLLSRSEEQPITMGALLRLEFDALGGGILRDRIGVSGPEIALRSSTVQTLALAIHELATNARKYGALAAERGRLDVSWSVQEQPKRHLELAWIEHGAEPEGGMREPVTMARGYGRELIERALPYALDARTSYELSPTGLRCTIDLPLERIKQADR